MKKLILILFAGLITSCGTSKEKPKEFTAPIEVEHRNSITSSIDSLIPLVTIQQEEPKTRQEIRIEGRNERQKERQVTKRKKNSGKKETKQVKSADDVKKVEAMETRKTNNVKARQDTKKDKSADKVDKVKIRKDAQVEKKKARKSKWWIWLLIGIGIGFFAPRILKLIKRIAI